jgi:hypothetical protein
MHAWSLLSVVVVLLILGAGLRVGFGVDCLKGGRRVEGTVG